MKTKKTKRKIYAVVLLYRAHNDISKIKKNYSAWQSRFFPKYDLSYIFVDNKNITQPISILGQNTFKIPGNNLNWEFSGYEKGLQFVYNYINPSEFDLVVISNDTVINEETSSFLKHDNWSKISNKFPSKSICGYIDTYPNDVKIGTVRFRRWIKSNFIIAKANNFKKLLNQNLINFYLDENSLFAADISQFFNDGAFSENYIKYMKTWLFGIQSLPEFPHVWAKASILNKKNCRFFKQKALSIIMEQMLTANAEKNGLQILGIN